MENLGSLGGLIPLWILSASMLLIVLLLLRAPRHPRRQDRTGTLPTPPASLPGRPLGTL